MPKCVVIDKDILGWADQHSSDLFKIYQNIIKVGNHPELNQRSFDQNIAEFCRRNDCDLLTGDARSYTYFFKAGIKEVKISKYDDWKIADKPVYLVQISQ